MTRPIVRYIVRFQGGTMKSDQRWAYETRGRAEYVAALLRRLGCRVQPIARRTGQRSRAVDFGPYTDVRRG